MTTRFSLPTVLVATQEPTLLHASVTVTDVDVTIRVPGGVVCLDRKKMVRDMVRLSAYPLMHLHPEVSVAVRTWDMFSALRDHGLFGRRLPGVPHTRAA